MAFPCLEVSFFLLLELYLENLFWLIWHFGLIKEMERVREMELRMGTWIEVCFFLEIEKTLVMETDKMAELLLHHLQ